MALSLLILLIVKIYLGMEGDYEKSYESYLSINI